MEAIPRFGVVAACATFEPVSPSVIVTAKTTTNESLLSIFVIFIFITKTSPPLNLVLLYTRHENITMSIPPPWITLGIKTGPKDSLRKDVRKCPRINRRIGPFLEKRKNPL